MHGKMDTVDESTSYYDALSTNYELTSRRRSKYINGVDAQIRNHKLQENIDRWLDIGSGDGRRTIRLVRMLGGCKSISLIEPSEKMFKLCLDTFSKSKINVSLFCCRVEDYLPVHTYELITCLWNVVGHADNPLIFLAKVKRFLSHGGTLILDCNNSFNVRNYGLRAIVNMIRFVLAPKKILSFPITQKGIVAHVKLVNPLQILSLLRQAGFKDIKMRFIDYESGKEVPWYYGQIVIFAS